MILACCESKCVWSWMIINASSSFNIKTVFAGIGLSLYSVIMRLFIIDMGILTLLVKYHHCIQSLPRLVENVIVSMCIHYSDVIMNAMASQIISLKIVYSTVYSGADQRKHQSSASLAFVRGIHRWSVNSQHKGPVTRKMFPFWWRHHEFRLVCLCCHMLFIALVLRSFICHLHIHI